MKYSKIILIIFLMTLFSKVASAHYLWIEAAEQWTVGKTGTIKIYYGEYAEGAREEAGKRLEEVNGLTAWNVTPNGEKVNLSLQKMSNHFLAEYTPKAAGKFEIELTNLVREVVDWTQYDIGLVQPTYYGHKPFYVVGKAEAKGRVRAGPRPAACAGPLAGSSCRRATRRPASAGWPRPAAGSHRAAPGRHSCQPPPCPWWLRSGVTWRH